MTASVSSVSPRGEWVAESICDKVLHIAGMFLEISTLGSNRTSWLYSFQLSGPGYAGNCPHGYLRWEGCVRLQKGTTDG